jgi:hypothetical protein
MTSIDSLCWFLETEHRKTTSILQGRRNRCAGDERQFDDQTCHCAKLFKAGISCALGPMAKRVESGARQWKATRLTLEWQQALMGRVELSACFSGLRSEQIPKIASETKRN